MAVVLFFLMVFGIVSVSSTLLVLTFFNWRRERREARENLSPAN